jgi:hypothetical protein
MQGAKRSAPSSCFFFFAASDEFFAASSSWWKISGTMQPRIPAARKPKLYLHADKQAHIDMHAVSRTLEIESGDHLQSERDDLHFTE